MPQDKAGTPVSFPKVNVRSMNIQDVFQAPASVLRGREVPVNLQALIPDLISEQARRAPYALAVGSGSDHLHYGGLECQANRLSRYLLSKGVTTGSLVALHLERSVQSVVAALAVLKAGAAYLPIDVAYPAARTEFILRDSGAMAVVSAGGAGDFPQAANIQQVDLDLEARQIWAQPDSPVRSKPLPDGLAYVIYTSGSTGRPKGVGVTHANVLNLIYWHQSVFGITEASRAGQLSAPAFDAAVWETWPYLAAGASIHLPGEDLRRSPAALRDWLVEEKITITFAPTPLAESLMELEWPRGVDLRYLLAGGDVLHRSPDPALPFVLVNNYGPTECTVVATSGEVEPRANSPRPPDIGTPIHNTTIYLLDESGKPVSPGEAGEIWIGGAGVAKGYIGLEDLNAAWFTADPFSQDAGARMYRSGDLGRLLPNGRLEFLGRNDQQIKIRGFRVDPVEISAAIAQHPAVAASTVTAVAGDGGEKKLQAYLELRTNTPPPTRSEMQQMLRRSLPDYMVPGTFVVVSALPVTRHGKIDAASLPPPSAENVLTDAQTNEAETVLQQRMAQLLARLLGVEQIGTNDNFFMLGGHSLLGTQVIARVRAEFGVELPLRTVFEYPTALGLAQHVELLILERLQKMSEMEAQELLQAVTTVAPETAAQLYH